MEKLKIICHKCNSLSDSIDTCSSCKYDLEDINLLSSTVVLAYNKAIELVEKKHLIKAWDILKSHLQVYPYVFEFLKLAFWLSIENGDYENTFKILKRLKPVISKEDYLDNYTVLKSHIEIYNEIISGKFDYDNIEDEKLSIHHLYILFLQTKRDKQSHVLNKINKIDPFFAATLTSGKILPSFRKMTLVKAAIVFVIGIMGILYNYYEFNERKDLTTKLDNERILFLSVIDSLEKKNNKLLMDVELTKTNNLNLEDKIIQLNHSFNKKKDEIEILNTRISNIQNERVIFEENLSELVKNNSTLLSELREGQENLFKLQTDNLNLTESIQELSKLSLSLKNQNDKFKDVIEKQKIQESKKRDFFSLIEKEKYKESLHYLETLEFRDFLHNSTDFNIEKFCEGLYYSKNYETLLDVPFDCSKKPDAFYMLYRLQWENDQDRIKNIMDFIDMFPNNENYTAPLLLELINNFISKADSTNTSYYALLLKEHVDIYPKHKKYYNSVVKSIIGKDK